MSMPDIRVHKSVTIHNGHAPRNTRTLQIEYFLKFIIYIRGEIVCGRKMSHELHGSLYIFISMIIIIEQQHIVFL